MNQDVRLETLAICTLQTDLSVIFAAFFQPRMLKHALKDQFAPVALSFLPLQGPGEIGCLITQTLVELLQTLQLTRQEQALTRLMLVAILDPFFDCLDTLF